MRLIYILHIQFNIIATNPYIVLIIICVLFGIKQFTIYLIIGYVNHKVQVYV